MLSPFQSPLLWMTKRITRKIQEYKMMEIYLSREKILSKDKIQLSKDNETKIWQIYYPNLNNPGKRTKMSTSTKNLNEARSPITTQSQGCKCCGYIG